MAIADSQKGLRLQSRIADDASPGHRRAPCARITLHDVLFMHWPVHACHLRPLLPQGIELDTFDGLAWIGIVSFRMSGIAGRWFPPLPWISGCPGVAVRTCVTVNGRPGIWYFSLDGANRIALFLARRMLAFPCQESKINMQDDGAWRRLRCQRIAKGNTAAELDVEYRAFGTASIQPPGTIAHWLTKRNRMFACNRNGTILQRDLEHAPWSMQSAQAIIHTNTIVQPLGLALPDQCPQLFYSSRNQVGAWRDHIRA